MLTPQPKTNILDRIKAARAQDSEPEQPEQPEELPQEEQPTEEATEDVEEAVEESEIDEEPEPQDDEEELFVTLGDKEVNLKEIKEWEKGYLRQSDYTRKTTELARERENIEVEKAKIAERQQQLESSLSQIEAIIEAEKLSDEEVAEMREYDPEGYIKYTERQAKLKELVKAKAAPKNDVNAEFEKVIAKHSDWMENGKPTEKFNQDIQQMREYLIKNNFTDDDLAMFTEKHFTVVLDAMKATHKADINAKRVRKAPVSSKPKSTSNSVHAEIKAAQERLKRTGRVEDAIALRKLKRKLG